MREDQEIKPCPFCGGVSTLKNGSSELGRGYWVECLVCRSGGKDCHNPNDAIKAWNKRN